MTDEPLAKNGPPNLFGPPPGNHDAHGRVDDIARQRSIDFFTDRHRTAFCALGLLGLDYLAHRAARLIDI